MPRILYRNPSGTVRSEVGYSDAEFGLMFRAADRATLNRGGAVTVNCGDPVGVILITRPDRARPKAVRPAAAPARSGLRHELHPSAGCPA